MSNFIPGKRKLVEKVFPKFARGGDLGYNIGKGGAGLADPKLPDIQIPKTPTIDDTAAARSMSDRLRRRRGVLANIFTSGTGARQSGAQQLGG